MADGLSKKGPADRTRVNVNEPWEVQYWTRAFNTTAEKLRAAVKAVGTPGRGSPQASLKVEKGSGPFIAVLH